MHPGEAYFRSCEGDWAGTFAVAHVAPGRAVLDLGVRGLGLLVLYAVRRLLPLPRFLTTVRVGEAADGGVRVDHTSRMTWLGVPAFQSREWVLLDGGAGGRFGGEERGLVGWSAFPPGSVRFDADATRATYAIHLAGHPLAQVGQTDGAPLADPPREARRFTLTQECAAFGAVIRLVKR